MAGDPEDIRAWQRIDAQTTTSGRIEVGDVARLAAIGVRHVINLALDDHPEALADEEELLAAQGIGYTHIPVPFASPGEEHFSDFCDALERGGRPVHIHCIMNWRVSAFLYRFNRDRGSMAEPHARALMEVQWCPKTSDYPGAAAWAVFIAPAG